MLLSNSCIKRTISRPRSLLMLNDINKNTKIFYKLFSSFCYCKSYRYSNIREQFIKRGTLKFFFHKNSYSSNLNSLVNFNKRSCTVKFDDVQKNYGLFRKGQHIGHISTLMQDPSDAVLVNEENSDELKYFTKLPKLSENFYEKLVEIKVSQRTKSPYNSPSGSWIQVNYLFSKFAELSVKYKKFTNNEIMVGKILEEIDVLSGESAYRYIKGRGVDLKGVIILTASVDQLDFNNYLSIEEDLKINTYVIYSGGSFIYVKSDIYSQSNDSLTFKGHAIFIMTARKDGKAFVVSPMELEVEDNSEMCKHREILGNELKEYITSLNTRIFKQSPDQDESNLIYSLFKAAKNRNDDGKVKMKDTLIIHNLMMQMQDRNVYGKIFGGYLMNVALDTAFLNARKFSEDINPKIVHIDTIKFIKPVESGHLMQFRSRITYTSESIVRISVQALDISLHEKEGNLTNEFHFVFELSKKAKEVIPETYFEALQYLEAKRRTEHILSY